jgi:hypothetical protein
VVGEWVAAAPIPTFKYLIALTTHTLYQCDDLRWDFNQHALDGSYSLSQPEALLWRRSGGLTQRCPCGTPRDCPLDRLMRVSPALATSPPPRPNRFGPALRPLVPDDDSDFDSSPPRRRARLAAAPADALP